VVELFFPLVILAVAFVPRLLAARDLGMTWDEGYYILCGGTALRNIERRKFSSNAWSFEFHPPVMMYVYALWYLMYVLVRTTLHNRRIPSIKLLYQSGLQTFTGQKTLFVARVPSVILGSLSCMLTYFLCLDVFGDVQTATVAGLLLAFTPSFIAWSSQVMLESGVVFFYLLTVLTLLRAVMYGSLLYLVVSGISLGLAFGSKETGFGLPVVVLPWLIRLLWDTNYTKGLEATFVVAARFALWLLIGLAVLYLSWPFLWKNPVAQFRRNLQSVLGWASRPTLFHVFIFLATTPIVLCLLFLGGIGLAAFMIVQQTNLTLILAWAVLPLVIMSLPFVTRHETYETVFIIPAFTICASLLINRISQEVAPTFNLLNDLALSTAHGNLLFLLLSVSVLAFLIFECAMTSPYYLNYCNQVARIIDRKQEYPPQGWFGEGMDQAIAYIDAHAPLNTTVWIYGPRGPALYHSMRIDLKNSTGDRPFFHLRAKAGFNVPREEREFYKWREGDLTFVFPQNYPNKDVLNPDMLDGDNVSYVVVYRWAICSTGITGLNSKMWRDLFELRRMCVPVFVVKINRFEICWIYDVNEIKRKISASCPVGECQN